MHQQAFQSTWSHIRCVLGGQWGWGVWPYCPPVVGGASLDLALEWITVTLLLVIIPAGGALQCGQSLPAGPCSS